MSDSLLSFLQNPHIHLENSSQKANDKIEKATESTYFYYSSTKGFVSNHD